MWCYRLRMGTLYIYTLLYACTSSPPVDTGEIPAQDPPEEGDLDQDGYTTEQGDCDDDDPDMSPGADDDTVDGVDQNCDGFDGPDEDGDGYADAAAGGDDCDDTDAESHPDAADDMVDGVDQDCDGFDGPDEDGDGYADAAAGGDDCDDTDASISPGAPELCVDGVDTDCDGLKDADDVDACPPFVGWSTDSMSLEDIQDMVFDGSVEPGLGNTVTTADLDGDDVPDLVVGAYTGSTVSIFLGASMVGVTDLSISDADYTITGIFSERLGESLASAGDLDGDGLDDLIIGAPYNDTAGPHAGAVYVFLASSFGTSSALSVADADHVLYGESMDDGANRAGRAVAASDLDGDDVPDLIIAATHNDDAATNAGKIYIVSGATLGKKGSNLADADILVTGAESSGYLGWAMSTGDYDGDGYRDLAASAYGVDEWATNAGAVYIWTGVTLSGASALTPADADVVIYGLGAYSETGRALSTVADLDGDGGDELFFGASGASSDIATYDGAAYLFLSRSLDTSGPLDVTDASYTFVGGQDDLYVGDDLGVAGDIDGDGLEDLLIGASGYGDEDAPLGGGVFVVSSDLLKAPATVDLMTDAQHLITESEPYAMMGWSWTGTPLVSAGDQDGDGLSDIAIGSPSVSNAVHVFYAADLTAPVLESGDASVRVSEAQGWMPAVGELVRIGDIDGDRLGDVMVLSAGGANTRGAACIFLGHGLATGAALDMQDADHCLLGDYGDYLNSVVSAGDVDGDGRDDILAAAGYSGEDGAGRVYLLLSSSLGTARDVYLKKSADYIFTGEVASDHLGWREYAISSAGDVDGDGMDDILLGAESQDENGEDAGRAYLFLASSLGDSQMLSAADADYIFTGEGSGNHLGRALAGVGDVDGDGTDDIMISAYGWGYPDQWPGDHVGKLYLFLGASLGSPGEVDLLTADYTFIGRVDPQRDYAGRTMMPGGDIDGDGLQDLVFSAYWNSSVVSGNGMFYVVLGASLGTTSEIMLTEADYSFVGAEEQEFAGSVMSQLGDVNGDGRDDLLFCSPSREDERGSSYLFLAENLDPSKVDYTLQDADYQFIGESEGDEAGQSGAIAGDLNGDGLDDLVIGASGWRGGAGRTYIVLTP